MNFSAFSEKIEAIKKVFTIQFIKFLLVGGLNTLFGYLIFSLFIFLTEQPTLSVILANITAVLFNFKTYGKFVFVSNDNSRIYRFCIAYIFLISLQILSLKGLAQLGISNSYLAGIILALPNAAISFVMLRKFVFAEKQIIK